MILRTIHGDMDDSLLQRNPGGVDNANETSVVTEYCLRDCEGSAHLTQTPDSPAFFCSKHVHRSVHVTVKHGFLARAQAGTFS